MEGTASKASNDNCPMDCFNQGACDFHDVTKEFYCDCPLTQSGGYQGIRCETPFLECSDGDKRGWRCLNGGQCKTGDTNAVCHCPDEFIGRNCQIFTGPINNGSTSTNYGVSKHGNRNRLSNTAIFSLTLSSVIIAAVFFISGFSAGRREKTSREFRNYETEQPEDVDSQYDSELPKHLDIT